MQNFLDHFYLFISVYLTGLALNLTPCVYPMMSVTVSLFGFQQEDNRAKSFLRALLYVMGLATMFSALGFSAAVGGAIFGQWLQNPVVLTVIGIFILALSLSMLGLYSFHLPTGLVNSLAKKRAVNWAGMYFAGLVAGIFAAPCIGPPIIALMTVLATKGNSGFAFWVFFTMALGLGTPYLILGTFSGLLKKLPKSGVWLVWVERFFGVILLSIFLFLFGDCLDAATSSVSHSGFLDRWWHLFRLSREIRCYQ
jgi:thiol:disulfide interchange protein DsbD